MEAFNYLHTIRQQLQEIVQAYTERFNKEAMKVRALAIGSTSRLINTACALYLLSKCWPRSKHHPSMTYFLLCMNLSKEILVWRASGSTWKADWGTIKVRSHLRQIRDDHQYVNGYPTENTSRTCHQNRNTRKIGRITLPHLSPPTQRFSTLLSR